MHQNVQFDTACSTTVETTAPESASAAVESADIVECANTTASEVVPESAEASGPSDAEITSEGDEQSIWYQLTRTQERIAALRKACARGQAAEQIVGTLDAMNEACEELTDAYEHYEMELSLGETDAGAELCGQIAFYLGEIDRALALFVPVARLQALLPRFCGAFDKRTSPTAH